MGVVNSEKSVYFLNALFDTFVPRGPLSFKKKYQDEMEKKREVIPSFFAPWGSLDKRYADR